MPAKGTHVQPLPRTTAMDDILETFRGYYKKPAVRSRILEFLGGNTPGSTTCEYITADGVTHAVRRPELPQELFSRLDDGLDICRSLWDRESLIAHLDVEYVNFDFAAEPYLDPARTFKLQEPVAEAIERILAHYGIHALHVLSGRGHHFAWQIKRSSDVFKKLCDIGIKAAMDDSVQVRLRNGYDSPQITHAFAGLGLLMEFLGRLVIDLASSQCAIPIELTAVEVDPSQRGREMISIDISEYGDPLPTRTVRVPFSAYLKPWQQLHAVGKNNISKIGPIIFIPLNDIDTRRGLVVMRDPELAAQLAERTSAQIPDQTEGSANLLNHYMNSPLRRFHDYFYAETHEPPSRWTLSYDRTRLDELPEAARNALLFPNDLLLRPCNMRNVTEALMKKGWHPRHIAGLIRSKFERDYGWGNQWIDYSPAMRADLYARIFSGRHVSISESAGEIRAADLHNHAEPWSDQHLGLPPSESLVPAGGRL